MRIALASAFDPEVLSFLRCCKTAVRDGDAQLVSQLKEDHFLISINATFHCCEQVEQEVSIMNNSLLFHFSAWPQLRPAGSILSFLGLLKNNSLGIINILQYIILHLAS